MLLEWRWKLVVFSVLLFERSRESAMSTDTHHSPATPVERSVHQSQKSPHSLHLGANTVSSPPGLNQHFPMLNRAVHHRWGVASMMLWVWQWPVLIRNLHCRRGILWSCLFSMQWMEIQLRPCWWTIGLFPRWREKRAELLLTGKVSCSWCSLLLSREEGIVGAMMEWYCAPVERPAACGGARQCTWWSCRYFCLRGPRRNSMLSSSGHVFAAAAFFLFRPNLPFHHQVPCSS